MKVKVLPIFFFLLFFLYSITTQADSISKEAKFVASDILFGSRYDSFIEIIKKLEKESPEWKNILTKKKGDKVDAYLSSLARIFNDLISLNENYNSLQITKLVNELMDMAQYITENFDEKILLNLPIKKFMESIGRAEVSQIKFLGWIENYLKVDLENLNIVSNKTTILTYFLKDSSNSCWFYKLIYNKQANSIFSNSNTILPDERYEIYNYNDGKEKFSIIGIADKSNWNFKVGYWDRNYKMDEKFDLKKANYKWIVKKIDDHTVSEFNNQKSKTGEKIITIFKSPLSLEEFVSYLSDKTISKEQLAVYRLYYDKGENKTYLEISSLKDTKIGIYVYDGEIKITPQGIKNKKGEEITPIATINEFHGSYLQKIPGIFQDFRRQHLIINIEGQGIDFYGNLYGYLLPSDIQVIKNNLAKISPELRDYIKRVYFLTGEQIKSLNRHLAKVGGFVNKEERDAIYLKIYHGIIPTNIGDYAHEATHLKHRDLDEKNKKKFTKLIKQIAETKDEKFGTSLGEKSKLGYSYIWKDLSRDKSQGPEHGAFSAYAWNDPYEYIAVAVENFYENPEDVIEIISPKGKYSYLHKKKYDPRYLDTLILAWKFKFIPDSLYVKIISKLSATMPIRLKKESAKVEKLIDKVYR